MLKLNALSKAKLKGVHPDLLKVLDEYLKIGTTPIIVIQGLRSLAEQKKNVAKGVSKTLRSRHLTGHAIDIAPANPNGSPDWSWTRYYGLAKQFKQAAKNVGVSVEWGGDWTKFKDGPHWQLPWNKYPAKMPQIAQNEAVMGSRTESGTAVGKASMITLGGFSGSSVAIGDTIGPVSDVLLNQQGELTSGEWLRVALAAVILITTIAGLYFTYRAYKDSQDATDTDE